MSSAMRRANSGLSFVRTWKVMPHVRHVRPRKAEEEVDVGVGLPRFPGQGTLHEVHPGGGAGPLQDRGGNDRDLHRDVRGRVVAAQGADQGAGGALALKVAVVMRVAILMQKAMFAWRRNSSSSLPCGSKVAAMTAPGPTTSRTRPGEFGFRAGHAANGHGAVDREVDTVERAFALQPGHHLVHETRRSTP